MPTLKIRIVKKADHDKPAFPELSDKPITSTELYGFAVIENGMQSGKTSVAFVFIDEVGKTHIIETSAAIFDGMYHALKGAEQRFKK